MATLVYLGTEVSITRACTTWPSTREGHAAYAKLLAPPSTPLA